MEVRSSEPSVSAPPRPPAGSVTISATSTTTAAESEGKHSSGETSRIKKRQSDRLTTVKKRTLAVVVAADIILLTALAYQMIWLNASLHGTFDGKVRDMIGFFTAQYGEQHAHLSMGVQLYARNASGSIPCQALRGDATSQTELQRRFGNDIRMRALEVGVVVDPAGVVMGTGNRRAGLGAVFNPQNIVTDLYARYGDSPDQLMTSVLVPRDAFFALGSLQNYAAGDERLELRTWANYSEILTRILVLPLQCGTSHAKGFLIWGDTWTPRQYDALNRLVLASKSSLVALFSRTTTGIWQMQYSYNNGGETGWQDRFPDLLPYFPGDDLDRIHASGGIQTGEKQLGGFSYRFGAVRIPKPSRGGGSVDGLAAPHALIVYAEPTVPIRDVVNTALIWHVPFGVFMALLSFVTLHHTFNRFINPMRLLIESVKKKKLKEFNERIRQLKQNRSTLLVLLGKTVLVQGVLLGLVFLNRSLLLASIGDFSSATTQGHAGPYLLASRARSLAKTLNGWTGFTTVINASASGTATSALRQELAQRYDVFDSDAIYLLTKDSVVLASTYRPSEGLVFPEIGVMEFYANLSNADLAPFTTLTSWHPTNINRMTPRNWSVLEPPALVRMAVAPVNHIDFNATDERFVMGDLVGALIVVRILNDYRSFWDSLTDAFGTGYYGIYQWDRFHSRFTPVSTLLQTDAGAQYGVDVTRTYPDLLRNGILTSYETSSVYIRDSVDLDGAGSSTVSVAPFFSPVDDVVLTPLMINAYQITGVPQGQFNDLLARQTVIQSSIMVVEFVTSLVALACTYWPMKTFLDNLEKAFNVPSLSHDKRQKMEERAAAMMDVTRPDSVVVSQLQQGVQSGAGRSSTNYPRRSQ